MQRKQRILCNWSTSILGIVLLAIPTGDTLADPCGMVPPISIGRPPVLARVGEQQTYVFFKDGIETFVIRPGFSGDVDNFGMLIPFPTPPAIRKVPDNIFPQIAAAVDPPEVVVDLSPVELFESSKMLRARSAPSDGMAFSASTVRVIRQEAVGMYEVAVLEAGSAAALKKWMDQNGFRYPTGMDAVCEDYVTERWCFVAVKTKVGQKRGVDPVPRQRKVDEKLPAGSVFDGFVQGMGFRFRTEKLVVPMRLSAFNEGELRNIVYLLTDGPKRINSISQNTVRRQLAGDAIYRNLTDPLPLRLIGGTEQDLRKWHLEGLAQRRNPDPKNGAAKRLFAADLLAARDSTLALPQEETEKHLLAVGEHFGLRGKAIDALHRAMLKNEARKTVEQALTDLSGMTLSVFDGDFPRRVVAEENLTFASYRMPETRNKASIYDARRRGPATKQPGIRKEGKVRIGISWWRWLGLGLFAGAGLICTAKRSRIAVCLSLIFIFAIPTPSTAEEARPLDQLLADLANPAAGPQVLDEAAERIRMHPASRSEITAALVAQSAADIPLAGKGWTIACLANIPGQDVDELLLGIQESSTEPMLVRTWAAAARVDRCRSAAALIEKASLISRFPALSRPIGKRLVHQLQAGDDQVPLERLLAISVRTPQLQQALSPMILASKPEELVATMQRAKEGDVRRQAAAYLSTLATSGDASQIASTVATACNFDPLRTDVPWQGGPLFIPGLAWQEHPINARLLVDQLIRWMLWCDRHGRAAEQAQIHNNLRSLSLARAVGYRSPGWQTADTVTWLRAWRALVGDETIRSMLEQQQVGNNPRYRAALDPVGNEQ
ncbi:MAG: DUF2330 domain-containing protein [Planctomycetota bacterium]|nr:DUF2330 domain-containing protein [Planctomycetota bacterium]